MISYAQNFEDVILWRVLKHIENGFYIDIGAWSPDVDSVTKWFYDQGWHGINIEPNPDFYNKYISSRPNDKNIKKAVSSEKGVMDMFFCDNPGLSSLDESVVKQHERLGFGSQKEEVEVTTLNDIFQKYVKVDSSVHFLKIDVEGFEKNVIKGNDWEKNRPWVLVVEATLPMSQEENYIEWEPILLNVGYLLAYADGLNRYYVAKEHGELLEKFKYPPNVFDNFKLFSQLNAEQRADQAERRADQAERRADQAEQRTERADQIVEGMNSLVNALNCELQSIYNSISWKITKPIRIAKRMAKRFWLGFVAWITFKRGSRPRRVILRLLWALKIYIDKSPYLRTKIVNLLNRCPKVKNRLRIIESNISDYYTSSSSEQDNYLGLRAKEIYIKLKAEIDNFRES
ncbi:FkbM family methyltransferase [Pseudofrancisella aestuarii]|uniref:FkbM family methyltransferase n=1 Tax=Pseudofrancisella aestuarii TaxID=2670347 RepID=A0ABV9TDE8_9GAMM|nr:FkbM family methyltransferase [Pseudofrancisella aestuarii]